MLSQSQFHAEPFRYLSATFRHTSSLYPSSLHLSTNPSTLDLSVSRTSRKFISVMTRSSKPSNQTDNVSYTFDDPVIDRFVDVGNMLADAAGEVIRKYFRKSFEVIDKEDTSPVTIADKKAEEAMVSIILENFPSHAIYGEENGWRCKEDKADYVWVLDPIDGTKSFITGKPLFGTLIALLYKNKPNGSVIVWLTRLRVVEWDRKKFKTSNRMSNLDYFLKLFFRTCFHIMSKNTL